MKVPVCVIVGAGPGNGAAFARQFSRAGYKVALLARGREGLDALTRKIAGTRAYPYDATDPADAARVFASIREELGPPHTLIYNASTRDFGDIDGTTPEDFERAWRVNARMAPCWRSSRSARPASPGRWQHHRHRGHRIAQGGRRLRRLRLRQGGPAQPRPVPRPPLGPEGIHVAHVIIDAMVDMPAARGMMPDAPDDFFARPDDIAESVHFLTRQPRSAWTFELDLRPFGESW
jgi:hypothetical protein